MNAVATLSNPLIQAILANTGITINGSNPWDPQIYNPQIFTRVLTQQELGLGEGYMDQWWDCERLDEFFFRILRANGEKTLNLQVTNFKAGFAAILNYLIKSVPSRIINLQKKSRAFEVGEKHYDIGNDLFSRMLDKEMNYTCGYWQGAKDLDTAQLNKLKLICDKLNLKAGERLLDIGCGFGGLARFAAKNYGVKVVGITVSKEQKQLAEHLNQDLPIEIRLQDYRDMQETFDKIVSVGMFEHVGYKNYATYMQVAERCLRPDGLFLLHTIGNNVTRHTADKWVNKYIFPNGMLPSISQIGKSCENVFVMEDWHNFGADYDKTLMAWHQNFTRHWAEIKQNYSERFFRMWNYNLLSFAGAFRARNLQLWQIVLSKKGILGGYNSIRP
jgi:cyclopropane-fatty-acyl-phospholipid synthase